MNREKLQGYVFSLPERVVRSVTGLAAGTARELSHVVLPARVRRSRLYDSIVEKTLQFLIEQVGQIEDPSATVQPLPDDFLIRRASGNVFELAGIVAFHASPVWVLAAIADLAGGGRELIGEIAEALESEGLLERGRSYQSIDQLLDGLERTAGRLAETVNTPPLDVASLRQEWAKLREETSRLPRAALPDTARLRRQWQELNREAVLQNRSVLELSSLMAVTAIRSLPQNAIWLSKAVRTGSRRIGKVFAEGILDHYSTTLTEIHNTGYVAYWLQEFRPYLNGAVSQFSLNRESLTERLIRSRKNRRP